MRAILIFLSIVLVSCGSQNDAVVVDYVAETKPVNSVGDAADDPAIWVNELNPQQSLIFGTDKRKGIHVYSLDGSELGFSELGATNNVDVRVLDETLYIATSNRTTSTIDLWSINKSDAYEFFNKHKDPFKRLNSKSYEANMNVYGICLGLYNNDLVALLTEEEGVALQFWNLSDEKLLNTINLIEDEIDPPSSGNEAEGCVFDDENETFFVSREGNDGILKTFSTQDQAFIKAIDSRDGNINGDPEGVAIYKTSNNEGFLIVSSQGDSTFNVYDRQYPHDFKYKFSVTNVADTDGLDIVNYKFSEQFNDGLMVAQDGYNTPNNQNFKIISVSEIKKKILLPGLSN